MSKIQMMAAGAGVLMLLFYLNERKKLQSGQGKPGYIFDGYAWVPSNGHYVYR